MGPHLYGPSSDITLDIRLKTAPMVSDRPGPAAFATGWTAWSAGLVGGIAGTIHPRISAYELIGPSGPGGGRPRTLAGFVRPDPTSARIGDRRLDSLAYRDAIRQMQSNLDVLRRVFGRRQLLSDSMSIVPVDRSGRCFAVSIRIEVARADDLIGHFGDAVDGTQTGLVSGNGSLIEGVGLTVGSPAGPLLGAWSEVRAGTGEILFARRFPPPRIIRTTVPFPDLTGGPTPTVTLLH